VAFLFQSKTDYLAAAGADASAAGAAGADASEAGAAAAGAGAGAGAGSSFLPQAARAAAAIMVANRSDFVMSIFLKWDKTISRNCHGLHHDRADGVAPSSSDSNYRVIPIGNRFDCQFGVILSL
jgi:hypothetical protein